MNLNFKQKLKNIFKSNKMPYIVIFFVILFLNFTKSTVFCDDGWFKIVLTGKINENITSIDKYIVWRYKTWSSRLIIETFLILFTQSLPFLWRILDSFIYVILAYSLSKLFVKEQKKFSWIVILLILSIPFEFFASAGWIATSLNYLWPCTFGLFSLIPLKKTLDKEKINKYEYVLYTLSALYACNAEQVCLCVFTVYFIFNVYFFIQKNVEPINIYMFILATLSIIFILTCPRK